MERLIFTVARGKPKYAEMAMGLGRSLSLIGDETPRAVLTDISGFDWSRYFDFVFEPKAKRSALDKLLAFDYTSADSVYAIDGDCLAFKRLGPVFCHCEGMDFAVQGTWQTEGKWHGAEVGDVLSKQKIERLPKFNGGAIFYRSTDSYRSLLREMQAIEADYGSTGFGDFRGNASEEVCVALAMMKTGIGDVISDETNFMNTGAGMIGNLKMDIRRNQCSYLCRRHKVRYVEPAIFHASEYANFRIYWRQLAYLKQLERYEDAHPPGYRSRWFKIRRSLERRWLKARGNLK